jgi:[ribosomal protein S5]-alanine N-acetyltransferase
MRWAGGPSSDVEHSARRLQRFIDHRERYGFSFGAVVERTTGTVIGDAGLIRLAFRGPEVELGYRLKVPYWGKGYATEVARAWLAYGFDELALDRIVGVTNPDNVASQRVLEKIGMHREGTTTYGEGEEVFLFAATR